MRKLNQYDDLVATVLTGMFGAPLYQSWLADTFDYKEMWSVAIIMALVSVYVLARVRPYVMDWWRYRVAQAGLKQASRAERVRSHVRILRMSGFLVDKTHLERTKTELRIDGFTNKEADYILSQLIDDKSSQQNSS